MEPYYGFTAVYSSGQTALRRFTARLQRFRHGLKRSSVVVHPPTTRACAMASIGKPSALGYRAFFLQASELVYATVHKNCETLKKQTVSAQCVPQAPPKDIEGPAFTYMQKIRRHGSQRDKNALSAIVLQWQTHSSISQREEELTVRILNTMHKNHCDYLNFTDILKGGSLDRANTQDVSTPRTPQQKTCLVWCSPVAFDLQEECAAMELDPVVTDGCTDLDHWVLMPQKDWNWSSDIETFFV